MMGKLLSGPWDQQPPERWATNQTEEIHPGCLREFLEHRHTVQQTRKPFDANGDVRPVHCIHAIHALSAFHGFTNDTCRFLRKNDLKTQLFDLPPLISLQSYYQSLSILHHIQDQVPILVKLIDAYRTDCCPPVSQSQLLCQRCAIQEQYRELWHYLTIFPDFFEALEEETDIHQKNNKR